MPDETWSAFCMFVILKEHRAFASKQYHEPPKEQKSKYVKRPQSHHPAKVQFDLTWRQSSLINWHSHKKLVASQERSKPEESIHKQVRRNDKAEVTRTNPVLQWLKVLNWALHHKKVSVSKYYHYTACHSHKIQYFQLLISLFSQRFIQNLKIFN